MKKLVVANWKGLPETLAQAQEILNRTDEAMRQLDATRIDLVICPPMRFLENVAAMLPDNAVLGAQDMEPQIVASGARYVIIGHSDRRWKLGESDEMVNTKLKNALENGLIPLVCLGERTRSDQWQDELTAQTAATFRGLSPEHVARCIIAYEPAWAISTSPGAKPDTPASTVRSMGLIREILADRFDVSAPTFLYGGSITPTNARDFLERQEISGVLVGGASVRPQEFAEILTIASTV